MDNFTEFASMLPSAQLCSICQSMDFSPLLFRPQDAKMLLEGSWDSGFDASNMNHPSLGHLREITVRGSTCPLCKMVVTAIHKHVDLTSVNRLTDDLSYHWKLGYSVFGSYEPRIPRPPYSKILRRLHLFTVKDFADGNQRSEGVFLHHVIQAATKPIPSIQDVLSSNSTYMDPAVLRPSGRLYGPMCDVALFRRWLDDCEQGHSCHYQGSAPQISMTLRLIDVHTMSLIQSAQTEDNMLRYCALSYVWGMDQSRSRLTKDNLARLMQPEGIKSLDLPRTISDSIHLVNQLGERFLWVDAICIVQDDPIDQAQQIPLMRQVYSRSLLTVVAASGESANNGLSGFGSGDRTFKQEVIILDDMALINCIDPVHDFWHIHLSNSKWNSRAWTLQERLLSPRCLIFTPQQTYWQCRGGSWCEESQLETSPKFRLWKPHLDDFFLQPNFLQPIKSDKTQSFSIYRYEHVVDDYSTRQLSFDTDALNAFLGVLDFFETEGGLSFLWGIPIPSFERSLCWFGTGSISPRANGDFPSWSWLAWHHKVEFITLDQGFHLIHAHKFRPALSSSPSQLGFSTLETSPIGSNQVPHNSIYHGTPKPLQERRAPLDSEIPSSITHTVRPDFHITFWTGAVSLQIGSLNNIDGNQYTEIFPSSFIIQPSDLFKLDTTKAWPSRNLSNGAIGLCFGALPQNLLENTKPAPCSTANPDPAIVPPLEFILLSKCSQQRHPYPSLRKPLLAMLISWDEKREIARREALAVVEEMDWFAARPEERLVILG